MHFWGCSHTRLRAAFQYACLTLICFLWYCLARCSGGVGRGDGSCLRAVSQKSDRARGPCGRSCGQRGGVGGRESMQGRGGKAQACGVSMQGGYVYIADTSPHTRVHLEVSGPAPGQWNTRTPAAPCARRFCGSFFRRASHSQPAGPRTARAGRGARSGDPSPHLSGPDWSPRPHGRPAGASGLNVAPRPARLCPHTHPHTHPHTRPHNTTLTPQTTATGGQSAETGRAAPPSAPSSDGTRMPTHHRVSTGLALGVR